MNLGLDTRLPSWASDSVRRVSLLPDAPDFLGDEKGWAPQLRTLAGIMFASKQPMFLVWGEQRTLLYNDAYAAILADRHPSAFGMPVQLVFGDVWDVVGPMLERAYLGHATHMDDLPLQVIRHGVREEAHFSFSYTPISSAEEGRWLGVFCACAEITDSVKAAQALRSVQARDARLSEVLDSMSEGFIVMDPQFRIVEINAEGVRIDGRPKAALLGRSHWELWPASVGTAVEAAYRQVADEKVSVQLRHRYVGAGHDIWIEIKAYPVAGGVAAFYRDVSALEHASAALRHSEDRFRAAMQAIGVLWTNDAEGRMAGPQPGWAGLTGQTEAEYQGFGWAAAVHPDDAQPTIDSWLQAVAERRTFVFEHRVRRCDGEWRRFAVRAVPVFETGGALREWVGVHIDITDAAQAAQALRRADRRKDEFLATLAHELRNPLAPIRTAAHLLAQPDLPPEKLAWISGVVGRQTRTLSRLLDDLLDTSRISSGRLQLRPERVTLDSVVHVAVETVRERIDARRHTLELVLPATPLMLQADPMRVVQVLGNLLANAAKYTDDGGTIRLEASQAGDAIHIAVVDNGVGIAPESLPGVFEMFGQVAGTLDRSEGGLGIGLALTKSLVEMHGGSIRASSAGLGHGSRFDVSLPAAVNTPT